MEEDKPMEAAEEPKGREAFLAMLKAENPEAEPTDEELWLKAHERYSGANSELSKYKEFDSNLKGHIAKDPRFGAVLSMVSEGKSYPYAHAKVYGKEAMELEGDDLEEFEKGYQENLAQMGASKAAQEKAMENIDKYYADLDTYCKDKSEEEKAALNEKIFAIADNMLNGIIPMETIELIDKGLTKDQDVQDAYDTGKAEGKNEKIDMKKKTIEMPDTANTSKTTPKPVPQQKQGSFYDNLGKA